MNRSAPVPLTTAATLKVAVWLARTFAVFPGRWRVERWIASQPHALLLAPARVLPLEGSRGLVVEAFNNRDMYVQPTHRDKDDLVLRVFSALLRPGDHVLDVGANIGRMSVLASNRVGSSGRVVAFEPSPMVIASLYKNIAFNGCGNVAVRNYAVSDADGLLDFHMPVDTNSGLGSFRDIGAGASVVIQVPIRRLDAESGLPERVRLIKIDTEGADLKVLRGATSLIRRARPWIVMEFSPQWIAQLGDSVAWLWTFRAEFGYSLYRLTESGPQRIDALPDRQIDLLCAPCELAGESWDALEQAA